MAGGVGLYGSQNISGSNIGEFICFQSSQQQNSHFHMRRSYQGNAEPLMNSACLGGIHYVYGGIVAKGDAEQ